MRVPDRGEDFASTPAHADVGARRPRSASLVLASGNAIVKTVTDLSEATALLLAGGLGTRLRSVVDDRPKVLAPVAGRPFVAYLLDQLRAVGKPPSHSRQHAGASPSGSPKGAALRVNRTSEPA